MKARPILFSGAMVRALMSGSKTQTRRVVKPQPDTRPGMNCTRLIFKDRKGAPPLDEALEATEPVLYRSLCPYGQPGDHLWVRETTTQRYLENFLTGEPTDALCGRYTADDRPVLEKAGFDLAWWYSRPTCPAIHMPRFASRITLEIVSVRVERLQDISEVDAIAEGCPITNPNPFSPGNGASSASGWYSELWESINGPGSWAANPWVWCIEFRKVTP